MPSEKSPLDPPVRSLMYDKDGQMIMPWVLWFNGTKRARVRILITAGGVDNCATGELLFWNNGVASGLVFNDGEDKWYVEMSTTPF